MYTHQIEYLSLSLSINMYCLYNLQVYGVTVYCILCFIYMGTYYVFMLKETKGEKSKRQQYYQKAFSLTLISDHTELYCPQIHIYGIDQHTYINQTRSGGGKEKPPVVSFENLLMENTSGVYRLIIGTIFLGSLGFKFSKAPTQ